MAYKEWKRHKWKHAWHHKKEMDEIWMREETKEWTKCINESSKEMNEIESHHHHTPPLVHLVEMLAIECEYEERGYNKQWKKIIRLVITICHWLYTLWMTRGRAWWGKLCRDKIYCLFETEWGACAVKDRQAWRERECHWRLYHFRWDRGKEKIRHHSYYFTTTTHTHYRQDCMCREAAGQGE